MTEMEKLIDILDDREIEYERVVNNRLIDGYPIRNQLLIDLGSGTYMSIICQFGSYGYQSGMLEYMLDGEVEGWLNAVDVYRIIKSRMEW